MARKAGTPYKAPENRQERRQIALLPAEWKRLDEIAREKGITRAELCRRAIFDYIERWEER